MVGSSLEIEAIATFITNGVTEHLSARTRLVVGAIGDYNGESSLLIYVNQASD